MNLEKMIAMQNNLDAHITKEKGLKETGNDDWKFLALDVELSEMANEWRGFKMWSDNKEPRTNFKRRCHACQGRGRFAEGGIILGAPSGNTTPCLYCDGKGVEEDRNPLLEEYADSVSFFLSIANEKGWNNALYLHKEAMRDLEEEGLQGGVTGALLEIKYHLLKSYMEKSPDDKIQQAFGYSKQEFHFRSAWFVFIGVGLIGFNFTLEQMETAYYEKNKINHQRQETGY